MLTPGICLPETLRPRIYAPRTRCTSGHRRWLAWRVGSTRPSQRVSGFRPPVATRQGSRGRCPDLPPPGCYPAGKSRQVSSFVPGCYPAGKALLGAPDKSVPDSGNAMLRRFRAICQKALILLIVGYLMKKELRGGHALRAKLIRSCYFPTILCYLVPESHYLSLLRISMKKWKFLLLAAGAFAIVACSDEKTPEADP